jgi:hypothetical protein
MGQDFGLIPRPGEDVEMSIFYSLSWPTLLAIKFL